MSETDEDSPIHHPHDSFNRNWFGDPRAAADVLSVVLPDSLKDLAVVENLHLEPVSFIDQQLRATQSDLLWRCCVDGADKAFFYILWEHQSRIDPWMPLRILFYMSRIWERWLAQVADEESGQSRPQLPVVFPMVLYQGKPKWKAPLSLEDLTAGLPEDLREFFPNFRFHLEQVAARDDSDFPPGLARLGISVLRLMWDDDFESWLDQIETQLTELHKSGDGDKLEVLLVYAFTQIDQSKRADFFKQVNEKLSPMVTTGKSIYDSLIEEGMEKGLEEGLEKGLEKGKQLMIRNMRENGLEIDKIAELASLSEAEVKRLLAGAN